MCSRSVFPSLLVFAILAVVAVAPASAAMQFEAVLEGGQEVPPNPSPATGIGTFTLNDAETQLSINITFSGLVAAESNAHIHGAAAPGINAGVRFGLPAGSPKVTVWNIPAADVVSLKAGLLYVNIHSTTYPGGEIRGQILASTPAQAASWGRVKAFYAGHSR